MDFAFALSGRPAAGKGGWTLGLAASQDTQGRGTCLYEGPTVCRALCGHLLWDLISCSVVRKSTPFMAKQEFFKSLPGEFMWNEGVEPRK